MLQKKGKTWDYFLFWSGFQSEKEDQSKRRQVNKSHGLVKKLKKEVITEVEEQTTQLKSSTQKVEEPEDVAKINEDDVVNTLNKDTNQEEGKCLLEQ